MAVAIFVLQPLAFEGGAPSCTADEEAAGLDVARRPGQIADTLETEHGVIDVERHHLDAVIAIRSSRSDPGGHGTGLGDALFQDLSGFVFLIEHQLVGVGRLVELAHRGVDTDLAEQAFHAEGAGLVRHDGHDMLADALVLHQRSDDAHDGHGAGDLAVAGALQEGLEEIQARHRQRRRFVLALRQVTAQGLTARLEVLDLLAVLRRAGERHLGNLVVVHRDVEGVAETLKRVLVELLLLVGTHGALSGLAHAETLDRVREDHGGLPLVLHRRLIGRIHLARIVSAAVQVPDLLVAHVGDHLQEFRIFPEELLADELAILGLEVLVLAVHAFHHQALQQIAVVALQQGIPTRTPQHLDHVPTAAAEVRFQLLDDLAVAAHRTVQALQVAVDHEYQVVQLFAGGKRDGTQGFRLVHLAVAEERAHTLRSLSGMKPRCSM